MSSPGVSHVRPLNKDLCPSDSTTLTALLASRMYSLLCGFLS